MEPLAVLLVHHTSLHEYLVCEVTRQNKRGYVAVIYRSPSQSSIEFGSVILGDFNVRSLACWPKVINNPNGTIIDYLTTTHVFKQLISVATRILFQTLPVLI